MQYSLPKFLTAMTIGRLLRYTLLAFLGAIYGPQILSLFSRPRVSRSFHRTRDRPRGGNHCSRSA